MARRYDLRAGLGFGMLVSPWAMRNGSASVTVAIESTPERTAIPADFADRVPTPRTTAKRALAARNDRNGKVLFALR